MLRTFDGFFGKRLGKNCVNARKTIVKILKSVL